MTALAIFARVYVSDLDEGIRVGGGTAPRLQFARPSGLQLALVGDVLVLAGRRRRRIRRVVGRGQGAGRALSGPGR
jgi:hypothetical protein